MIVTKGGALINSLYVHDQSYEKAWRKRAVLVGKRELLYTTLVGAKKVMSTRGNDNGG